MNYWQQPLLPVDTRSAAWDYLTQELGAHVALVQEAVPPPDLPRDRVVYGELAGHRNWGRQSRRWTRPSRSSPIRSVRMPWSRRRFLLANANPGAVAVAKVTISGIEPITFVSVYGVWDGSVVASMYRAIADLVPLFDSPLGARVILGGDLNVTRSTADPAGLARADAVIAAIRSLGLVEAKTLLVDPPAPVPDCPCGNGQSCGHVPTWGRKRARPCVRLARASPAR